jgi:hypothetical protein
MVSILEAKDFFFRAMLSGWALGGKKITISEMPGYKAIPYREGDFYLLDRWCSGPGIGKSAGATTIWFQNVPVWVMHYGGCYESEEVVRFVKRALRVAYEGRAFFGGRGPAHLTDTELTYRNFVKFNEFRKFGGTEEVRDHNWGLLGFHDYWGMSLM